MGLATFKIKRHDLFPYYPFGLTGVDLTGATIRATCLNKDLGTFLFFQDTTRVVITNATLGEGEVRWAEGDTDLEGNYQLEFEIIPAVGLSYTVPIGAKQNMTIEEDLDNQ